MCVQDDTTIPDDEVLLRRISPDWYHPENSKPVSTQAFQNLEGDAMSVHLQGVLTEHGLPPESTLDGHAGYGLVALLVGDVRTLGQIVVRDGTPDDPAHAHLIGKKSNSIRKKLRDCCRLLVEPA